MRIYTKTQGLKLRQHQDTLFNTDSKEEEGDLAIFDKIPWFGLIQRFIDRKSAGDYDCES